MKNTLWHFHFRLIDEQGRRSEAEGIGYTWADAAFNSTDIFPGEGIDTFRGSPVAKGPRTIAELFARP